MSRQVICKHLCITRSSRDNLVIVDHATDQPLPLEAYTWLVKHLSREGDTVIDVDSSSGSACVAALKGGRNGCVLCRGRKNSAAYVLSRGRRNSAAQVSWAGVAEILRLKL